MRNNTTVNNETAIAKEVSLEELDVLCRKFNHLHDEEVFRIITQLFWKIADFFSHEPHQPCHSSSE